MTQICATSEIYNAEIRARTFLLCVMGKKRYNKLTKDGKIEIKSGKNIYILDKDGVIVNKTTRQAYCITTGFNSYPPSDIIAIKYAWLKYRIDTVERVANVRYLSYREKIEKIHSKNLFSGTDILLIMLVIILIMVMTLLIYVIFKY